MESALGGGWLCVNEQGKQRGEGGDWIGKLGENSLGDKGEQGAGRFKGLCGRERALR